KQQNSYPVIGVFGVCLDSCSGRYKISFMWFSKAFEFNIVFMFVLELDCC
uniref:Uncharacterized protein n=1 Tax=Triticum urartu TaxID=4572 RepID=A0A8R7NY28_TRIUA